MTCLALQRADQKNLVSSFTNLRLGPSHVISELSEPQAFEQSSLRADVRWAVCCKLSNCYSVLRCIGRAILVYERTGELLQIYLPIYFEGQVKWVEYLNYSKRLVENETIELSTNFERLLVA